MKLASRRLAPAEMYPAGEPGLRARMVPLRSGIRVRVVEAGDETSPPIVLIHGWACSVWMFHDNIESLARSGFRVFAVDLKGHGLSEKPDTAAEYSVGAMREHVIDILDGLGLQRAGLAGHSMGAALAVHVAALAPERVAGVAVLAPVGFAGVRGLGLLRALTPRAAIPLMRLIACRSVVRVMLATVYGSIRLASDRDVDEFWAPTQFAGFVPALRHLLHEFDWDAPFPDVAVPMMTLVGSRDRLSLERDSSLYPPAARGTPFLVVEGAGHVLLSEQPGVVNAALAGFFRRTTSPDYISVEHEQESHT